MGPGGCPADSRYHSSDESGVQMSSSSGDSQPLISSELGEGGGGGDGPDVGFVGPLVVVVVAGDPVVKVKVAEPVIGVDDEEDVFAYFLNFYPEKYFLR